MKKIKLIIFLIIITTNFVYANEFIDITENIEIKYKWYKDVVSEEKGEYYPLKDVSDTDVYDENNIKYIGTGDVYNKENCALPSEYYVLDKKVTREYYMPKQTSYVLIEGIEGDTSIKIYYQNVEINYSIVARDKDKIKINLKSPKMCDQLSFYVDDDNYKIGLYLDLGFKKVILSKNIQTEKITVPDDSWIVSANQFITTITEEKFQENSLVKLLYEKIECSYKEKYVYKYNQNRQYYDDNYHSYVEGFVKDVEDYKVYYKGEMPTTTVEIINEKTIEIPRIEYVYIESQSNNKDLLLNSEISKRLVTHILVNNEIREKVISKIPIVVYIIFLMLVIIITTLLIKTFKNNVE